jgi:hypothetical protein
MAATQPDWREIENNLCYLCQAEINLCKWSDKEVTTIFVRLFARKELSAPA